MYVFDPLLLVLDVSDKKYHKRNSYKYIQYFKVIFKVAVSSKFLLFGTCVFSA